MAADRPFKNLWSDIAPIGGRIAVDGGQAGKSLLSWNGSISLGGQLEKWSSHETTIELRGKVTSELGGDTASWIELETAWNHPPSVAEIFLVGSRPLPRGDITAICRHPLRSEFLLAATGDAKLLWLEADLQADLKIAAEVDLPAPVVSMACSGSKIVALGHDPIDVLIVMDLADRCNPPAQMQLKQIKLEAHLIGVAENDGISVWGLNSHGTIYKIQLEGGKKTNPDPWPVTSVIISKYGQLSRGSRSRTGLKALAMSIYRAFKNENYSWWRLLGSRGSYQGFAFDGRHFWAFRGKDRGRSPTKLLMYGLSGEMLRGFISWPQASVSSLSYTHNLLMVVDRENQQFHQYFPADTMQPVAGGAIIGARHPGYLPPGQPETGGIHNLCLLYTGGQETAGIHRYHIDQLRPLAAYISEAGVIQDQFMDGFLLLAQYSPLLNGRAYAADLKGPPSLQEDWNALFNEYFHDNCNLPALDNCAGEITRQLPTESRGLSLKVVLAIPTPDQRCTNWDQKGWSLADSRGRIDAIEWAMQDLSSRWQRAGFKHLQLAGFYYMDEQGAWNDPVMQAFTVLCRNYGGGSFAIPGISSAWITEFKRAGFGGVALQSSHAFRDMPGCPPGYLLKCAANIAREFKMGMEVELPYNVMQPGGREKLREYLDMAVIQGWAGAFKAYFQSYNLIYDLAASPDPDSRQLYDDLYRLSRNSYPQSVPPVVSFQGAVPVKWQGRLSGERGQGFFKLNYEGSTARFELTDFSIKQ